MYICIVVVVVVVVVVKGNASPAPANNSGEGGDETKANWDPENRCPGRLAFTGCYRGAPPAKEKGTQTPGVLNTPRIPGRKGSGN